MRIKSLKIEKLFGCFDYDIDFKDNNITIITGPNGYGKTKCLNIIDAIFNEKFSFFINLDFENILLTLNNEQILHINKDAEEDTNNITISDNQGNSFSLKKRAEMLERLEQGLPPFLTMIDNDLIFNSNSERYLTLNEVFAEYSDRFPRFRHFKEGMAGDEISELLNPKWLKTITDSLNVYMIIDQRLISKEEIQNRRRSNSSFRDRPIYIKTIEQFAKQLSAKFQEIDRNASLKARELDRSFPFTLINNDKASGTPEITKIKAELEKITAKRNNLIAFGLEKPTNQTNNITLKSENIEKNINALELYIKHENEKLASYDKILEKLELFQKLIESKKLTNKELQFDFEQGFYFKSLNSNKELPLSQLSSGEQHQIVLLYELIFNVEENTLLLIDEPEISLHVVWQRQVLDDLQAIAKIQKMTVLIATHSPQIVNGKWDLAVNLGAINGAE